MSKGIAGALATQLQIKLATEPLILVEVEWRSPNPLGKYADKDFEAYQGRILTFSGLEALIKLESGGTSTSMTLTLSDVDDTIKGIINTSDIHKTPVNVYQTDASLTSAAKILLFEGEIASPITWSEHDRQITFTILTKVESEEIGFSPESGDLPFVAESAIGKAWPLCFGSPLRVPVVKITEAVRGTSLTRYGQITITDLDRLCSAAESAAIAEDAKSGTFGADTQPGYSDANYATVVNTLTSATIDLNNIVEQLSSESPTQRNNLIAYADACQFTKRAQIDLALNAAIFIQASTALATAQATLVTLQVELLQAQSAIPINIGLVISIGNQIVAAQTAINTATTTIAASQLQIVLQTSNISVGQSDKNILESNLLLFVLTQILVEGGEKFPQGSSVVIIINGMKFQGVFSGQVFTIGTANLPFYSSVPPGGRLNSNTNEYFVFDTGYDLKGKFLFFGDKITYCESQEGTRCFINPILYEQTGALPQVPGVLVNGQPVIREIYEQEVIISGILDVRVFVPKSWLTALTNAGLPDYANGRSNIRDQDYGINIGDDVYLDGDFQDKYVANLIPSSSIVEVIGRRDGVLTPIPTRYYTYNLSDSIIGKTPTTISLRRPLPTYVDEKWTDEVYVSLVSTEGPNTADVIEYLLNEYTTITPDVTTFGAVATSLTNYPSHFALLDRSDALTTVEAISWQARCGIYLRNTTAYIKYLSAEEAELFTLTESNIKDLIITTKPTEELVTKFTAEWRTDYTLEEPKKIVLRNNIPKYGEQKKTFDFYIYNIEELVVKSATFWMIRMSNTWKLAKFTAFLDTLDADIFDTIKLSLGGNLVADQDIKGVIQEVAYNPDDNTLSYSLETEVLFGDLEPHPFFWPATAPGGVTYPTAKDPYAGSS